MDLDFHLNSNEGHMERFSFDTYQNKETIYYTCNQTRKSFRNSKKNNIFLKNPALLSILQTRKKYMALFNKIRRSDFIFYQNCELSSFYLISFGNDLGASGFFFYYWVQPTLKCLLNLDNKNLTYENMTKII